MKFLLTVQLANAETLNCWTDTKTQALVIARALTDSDSVNAVEVHELQAKELKYLGRVMRTPAP